MNKQIVTMIKEIQEISIKNLNKGIYNPFVKNNILYMTDIHRVLCIKTNNMQDGEYCINFNDLIRIGDIRKDTPEIGSVSLNFKTDRLITFSLNKKTKNADLSLLAKIFPHFFNIDLVSKIIPYADDDINFRYIHNEALRPFVFEFSVKNFKCLLLVMPMNMVGLQFEIEEEMSNTTDYLGVYQ